MIKLRQLLKYHQKLKFLLLKKTDFDNFALY